MTSLLWALKSHDSFDLILPLLVSFLIAFLVFQPDSVMLVVAHLVKLTLNRVDTFVSGSKSCYDGLVIIPSLLRNHDDFNAITVAVDSVAENKYPTDLVIIASVDGRLEQPELYADLIEWKRTRQYALNVHLHITGLDERRGKMMAIDAGCEYMKRLVSDGLYKSFPRIYFSLDGDGTLSMNALERMAVMLATPHKLTGNPRRAVSGKIYVRKELVWGGWRSFFTIKGQIYSQVVREFIACGIHRSNCRPVPYVLLAGALYCTWSEILIEAPRYMGFLSTVTFIDYIKWWFGVAPPSYVLSTAKPIPEALTGMTDDTSMAYIAMLASWKNGRLSLEFPRTPLHAFLKMLRECFVQRAQDYEPEAKVYTFTPSTVKGLWDQRVRWNSSRVECSMRFTKAMLFHWDLLLGASVILLLILRTVVQSIFSFIVFPIFVLKCNSIVSALCFGYVLTAFLQLVGLFVALFLESERRQYWKSIISVPSSIVYNFVFGVMPMIFGVVKDVALFGSDGRFVPEQTLIRGNSVRIALLYRMRRFVTLCIRSVMGESIPWGTWWFGFREHLPFVDSGYRGWTSGKKSQYLLK